MAVERSYVYKDGEKYMEVLVSYGYGAGWSTWNGIYGIDLAIDKRIIDFFKEHQNANGDFDPNYPQQSLSQFFQSIGYTEHIYFSGWYDCGLCLVKKGTIFKIEEYDGSEYIDVFDQSSWTIVE